ncbi:MAG: hypothetical protein P8X57_10975 [Cyclobacteriaceae bacterium]
MKLLIILLIAPITLYSQKSQNAAIENVLNNVNSIINVEPGEPRNIEDLRNYFMPYEERITGRVIENYNGIAHVYESFYAKDSEGEEVNGLSSYQLVFLDGNWQIISILWTDDSNGKEIPEKYLSEKD